MALTSFEKKLIRRLLKRKHLNEDQALAATKEAERQGVPVQQVLVGEKLVDEMTITRSLARIQGSDFLDLEGLEPSDAVLKSLNPALAHRYRAIPVGEVDGVLVVAVDDMSNIIRLDEFKAVAGRPVRMVLATNSGLTDALRRFYSGERTFHQEETRLETKQPLKPEEEEFESDSTLHSVETVSDTEAAAATHALRQRLQREIAEARTHHDSAETVGTGAREARAPAAQDDSGMAAADVALRELLEAALANRAEELEFPVPAGKGPRTRIRREGAWTPFRTYATQHHEPILSLIRDLAGIKGESEEPVERHFKFTRKTGPILVVAIVTKTSTGNRALLRFPGNVPILQQPLRLLNAGRSETDRIGGRLKGIGGGLFLLTSGNPRICAQVFNSMLFEQAGEGRTVMSLHHLVEREIPGVSQVVCRDDRAVAQALSGMLAEEPDLIGVSTVTDSPTLRDLFAAAMKGSAVLAAMTSPDSATARASLQAADIDKMHIVNGLIAHAHVERLSRLCPDCQEMIERSLSRLPEWAEEVDSTLFFEAKGCASCGNTGRKGSVWVPEVYTADPDNPGALKVLRTREESLQSLVEGGLIDVREAV